MWLEEVAASVSTLREWRRAEMSATIIKTARMLLATGGKDAISVRAVAREIGVTPAAIYRYYSSAHQLVNELCRDILGDLDAHVELARDQDCSNSAVARFREMVRAFRSWALDHPQEFWLALTPRPGMNSELNPDPDPRVVAHFYREFLRAQEPLAVAQFLSAWTRLMGLVTIEVSSCDKWMPVTDADNEALFEEQLAGICAQFSSALRLFHTKTFGPDAPRNRNVP